MESQYRVTLDYWDAEINGLRHVGTLRLQATGTGWAGELWEEQAGRFECRAEAVIPHNEIPPFRRHDVWWMVLSALQHLLQEHKEETC